MNKKAKKVLLIIIAILISVATHILPMFYSLPKCIYLNIIGTSLVIFLFGPLGGALYSGLLHIILNNIGMGMGTQLTVLLSQIVQALILGLLIADMRKEKLILSPLIMSLISLPISIIIQSIFNKNLVEGLKNMLINYPNYIKTSLLDNLLMYSISIMVALIIIKISRVKE